MTVAGAAVAGAAVARGGSSPVRSCWEVVVVEEEEGVTFI
jgi:hypothetical protein